MFKDKILLISVAAGSSRESALSRSLTTHVKETKIFSRGELKQDRTRKFYHDDKLAELLLNPREI